MEQAMSRIEVALARIEQVAAQSPENASDEREANGALRMRMDGVLRDLDRLIAEMER